MILAAPPPAALRPAPTPPAAVQARPEPSPAGRPELATKLGLPPATTLVSAAFDLNRDDRPEVIAYVADPARCGPGGCSLYVVDGASGRVVMRATVSRPPVQVLATRSHGWRDLSVSVGGAASAPHRVRLSFDGNRYPANAGVAPTTTAVGHTVIAADVVEAVAPAPRKP